MVSQVVEILALNVGTAATNSKDVKQRKGIQHRHIDNIRKKHDDIIMGLGCTQLLFGKSIAR